MALRTGADEEGGSQAGLRHRHCEPLNPSLLGLGVKAPHVLSGGTRIVITDQPGESSLAPIAICTTNRARAARACPRRTRGCGHFRTFSCRSLAGQLVSTLKPFYCRLSATRDFFLFLIKHGNEERLQLPQYFMVFQLDPTFLPT